MRHGAAAALLFLSVLAGGCDLLHDDYPDRTCHDSSDCFKAQGEYCERDAGVCLIAKDAAPAESEEQPPPPVAPPPPARVQR